MRWLWRQPLELVNDKLVAFLGEEPHTPLDVALGETLRGLGCLGRTTSGRIVLSLSTMIERVSVQSATLALALICGCGLATESVADRARRPTWTLEATTPPATRTGPTKPLA